MENFPVVSLLVALLFTLMAVRAFLSGSVLDYVLAGTQGIGVLLLFSQYHDVALWLLLASVVAYLLSQILTGARLVSRLLPLAGGAMVIVSLLL
ncbi:Uncharacterised protein [Halioglobus japonicus]|nr:Uncharacterised protein [Halioglobus japonicus]